MSDETGEKKSVTWIIRDSKGRLQGPLSTSALVDRIRTGELDGNESIAEYPGGKWRPISVEPEFYDRLISIISNSDISNSVAHPSKEQPSEKAIAEGLGTGGERGTDNPEDKTEHIDLVDMDKKGDSPQDSPPDPTPSKSLPQSLPLTNPLPPSPLPTTPLSRHPLQTKQKRSIIELKNLKKGLRARRKKAATFPLFLVAAAALLIAYALSQEEEPTKEIGARVHLVPLASTSQNVSANARLSKENIRAGLAQAMSFFQDDTFLGYLESQNRFVSLASASPQNTEIRSLLCMTYKELWPFAYQDSADHQAFSNLVQTTRMLNPTSIDTAVCEIAQFLALYRMNEAKLALENGLERFPTSSVLFLYKGELVAASKDFLSAEAYFIKSAQLWPNWIKSHYLTALMKSKLKRYSDSVKKLREINKSRPNHKAAKNLLGIIEVREFGNTEIGISLLQSATHSTDRIMPNDEVEGLVILATHYFKRNDKKKALEFTQKAMTLNSNSVEAKQLLLLLGGSSKKALAIKNEQSLYLGDQYAKNGDCLAAQAEYRAAFVANSSNALAAYKAAQCLWILFQTREAIEFLEKAIQADPLFLQAYTLLADYHSQRHNFAAAGRVLTMAREASPTQNHEVLKAFATVEFRRNSFKQALLWAQQSLKLYDTDPGMNLLMAEIQYSLQEFQFALSYAHRAIELDATLFAAHNVYAKSLAKLQGGDAGASYLQDLVIKYPNRSIYRQYLGDLYRDQEKYPQAQQIYQQLVATSRNSKMAWLGLGQSNYLQKQYDAALKAFLSAATQDPTDPEPIFMAGLVYLDSSRFSLASQQFQRVLKINEYYPRTHYFVGRSALLLGDLQLALSEAELEKKLNPSIADAYILSAEVYNEAKQFSKCAEEYQQAIRLRGQNAMIYVKLARCYRKAGQTEIAASMLNIAASKESGFAEIYKEQGAVYETIGDESAAVEAYRTYLSLSPNALDKNEIQSKIDSL